MAKCHDNRKARERRRRRQQRQDERRAREREQNSWLCECGNWIEDGFHCDLCKAEPPWGCPCGWCQGERYCTDEDFDDHDWREEDDWEPVGSCENCGGNVYPNDEDGLCDQCSWYEQNDEIH